MEIWKRTEWQQLENCCLLNYIKGKMIKTKITNCLVYLVPIVKPGEITGHILSFVMSI